MIQLLTCLAPQGLPYTPGRDGAGVVEKVGAKVTKVKEGDRVWLSGSVRGKEELKRDVWCYLSELKEKGRLTFFFFL